MIPWTLQDSDRIVSLRNSIGRVQDPPDHLGPSTQFGPPPGSWTIRLGSHTRTSPFTDPQDQSEGDDPETILDPSGMYIPQAPSSPGFDHPKSGGIPGHWTGSPFPSPSSTPAEDRAHPTTPLESLVDRARRRRPGDPREIAETCGDDDGMVGRW